MDGRLRAPEAQGHSRRALRARADLGDLLVAQDTMSAAQILGQGDDLEVSDVATRLRDATARLNVVDRHALRDRADELAIDQAVRVGDRAVDVALDAVALCLLRALPDEA